jgi:hypothetical protein
MISAALVRAFCRPEPPRIERNVLDDRVDAFGERGGDELDEFVLTQANEISAAPPPYHRAIMAQS